MVMGCDLSFVSSDGEGEIFNYEEGNYFKLIKLRGV